MRKLKPWEEEILETAKKEHEKCILLSAEMVLNYLDCSVEGVVEAMKATAAQEQDLYIQRYGKIPPHLYEQIGRIKTLRGIAERQRNLKEATSE